MSERELYRPGPAGGASVEKGDDKWTLVLVRELHHAPENVWLAITDPDHLAEWAPFDASRSLAAIGPVTMSMARAPKPQVFESAVSRAEPPRLLEYNWGGSELRWELEPVGGGTRLTLWHNIDSRYIAWGAAGWHICFDVLDRLLAGKPVGRIVGGDAVKFEWQRLVTEYAAQFGTEAPRWSPVPEEKQGIEEIDE